MGYRVPIVHGPGGLPGGDSAVVGWAERCREVCLFHGHGWDFGQWGECECCGGEVCVLSTDLRCFGEVGR